ITALPMVAGHVGSGCRVYYRAEGEGNKSRRRGELMWLPAPDGVKSRGAGEGRRHPVLLTPGAPLARGAFEGTVGGRGTARVGRRGRWADPVGLGEGPLGRPHV